MSDVTKILSQIESGDSAAADELLLVVYEELRKLAAAKLAQEKPGLTLQATALVHEAWMRLVNVDHVPHWSNRRHFFGAAAEAMRRILVDEARRRNRYKRGGDRKRITIQLEQAPVAAGDSRMDALDEALVRFEQIDPTACELVKLRYFAGLSLRDAGLALNLAPRTADRLWAYAKAWLMREIQRDMSDSS